MKVFPWLIGTATALGGAAVVGYLTLDSGPKPPEKERIEAEVEHFARQPAEAAPGSPVEQGNRFYLPMGEAPPLEFVWVPATTSEYWRSHTNGRDYFLMGGDGTDYSPYRLVRLTYGYYTATTEITITQWEILTEDPDDDGDTSRPQTDMNRPVADLNRTEIGDFLTTLQTHSERTDIIPVHGAPPPNYVYRLPTEAEWEYAARAGRDRPDPASLDLSSWHGHASDTSMPVGEKEQNPWGIHDTLGNVFEMTADCWPSEGNIRFGDANRVYTDPLGPGDSVNSRGGAWYSSGHVESFAWRAGCNSPAYHGDHLGFRVVLAPPIEKLEQAAPDEDREERVTLTSEPRRLRKIQQSGCDEDVVIHDATVTREFNDRIELRVCVTNLGERTQNFSAITYFDGENTGKWASPHDSAEPGQSCVDLEVGQNSLFPYESDALKVSASHSRCEALYRFNKTWRDGSGAVRNPAQYPP